MNIGIVGLGLIGGSLAKAFKKAECRVWAMDKDMVIQDFAFMNQAIDGVLDDTNLAKCDAIFIAITPDAAIAWMEKNAPILSHDTLIIDCCGTKRKVCENCFRIAREYNLTYMGGHPMAGLEHGGFKYSKEDLFVGAPFILVPHQCKDMDLLCGVKRIILKAGFDRVFVTNAEEHDRVIAFTSQMPHVVSNAFIKSPTALEESKMISAGSYEDFTRVAYLDEKMWSELFVENRDNLIKELDTLINELKKYQQALVNNSVAELSKLLLEGKKSKIEVDGRCI